MALKGTLRGVMLQHCSWPRLAGLAGSKRARYSCSTTSNSTEEIETCSMSCPEGMLATATVHAASGTAEEATVKAYAALMNVLNHQRPTFMAMFTSAPHGAAVSVSSAVRQLLDASVETQASSSSNGSSSSSSSTSSSTGSSSNQVPLLGCTAGRWLPPSHALVSSSTNSSQEPAVSEQRHSHCLPHYTLAAAVLPGVDAHAFYSCHDSLPPLPQQLQQFLQSKPQVLVLGHPADQQHHGLLQRFENLVPGSMLAGAAAGVPHSATTSSCAVDGATEDLPDSDVDISNGSSSSGRGEQALNNEAKSHGRKRLHKMLTARLRQQASNVDEDMVHLSASAKLLALLDDPMFRLGKQMMAASDSSQHVEPALLWDNQVYSEGLAGLLLMPQPTARPLSSSTSAALVCMMLGNNAKFSHVADSLLLGQGVREELVCSAEQAAAVVPADAKQATRWQSAHVTPPGLIGTGASEQQSPTELPVFGVQLSEQLWPFQAVPMTVFEERYQLLLRQLLPAAGTGAGAATRCFGIIHKGHGITAAVLGCEAGKPEMHGHSFATFLGGRRFRYNRVRILPATFGLPAVDPEYIDDVLPSSAEGQLQLRQLAARLLMALQRAHSAHKGQRQAAKRFASSLWFAHTAVGSADRNSRGSNNSGAVDPECGMTITDELLEKLTPQTASQVSLACGAVIPAPSQVKTEWFLSQDPVRRLETQLDLLESDPATAEAAATILALMPTATYLKQLMPDWNS